uniref:B-like cyclin n=1 Tax=Rhizophora mucronata TaxID=61149 RepID=A0A2P2JQR6_RHIMU
MANHRHESDALLQQSQCPQNSKFLNDALYCAEDYFRGGGGGGRGGEEAEEGDCYFVNNNDNRNSAPVLQEPDLCRDNEELSCLFAKEERNHLHKNFENNPFLAGARLEAVDWILKVNSHHSFTALTAVLAVNYLDRFLFSFLVQAEKPWMTQLAAVACLSLAAKMEETHVPLLLDLQVEDCRYVFEAKTIQRMEILVLSTLQWKMNPITPVSFLDYIARRLGLRNHLCWEFLRRCECIILSVISDSRSMNCLPSAMATATILHVINGIEPCLGAEYQSQLLGILGIDKDKVEDCSKLIVELASRDHCSQSNKRKSGSIPGSPNGVIDASFSSDSSYDSWSVASSVSSSPEPLSKKTRSMQNSNNATADFLSIPR